MRMAMNEERRYREFAEELLKTVRSIIRTDCIAEQVQVGGLPVTLDRVEDVVRVFNSELRAAAEYVGKKQAERYSLQPFEHPVRVDRSVIEDQIKIERPPVSWFSRWGWAWR